MQAINESLPRDLSRSFKKAQLKTSPLFYFEDLNRVFDFENSEYIPLSKQEAVDLYKSNPEQLYVILNDDILIMYNEDGVVLQTKDTEDIHSNLDFVIENSVARYKVIFKSKDTTKLEKNVKDSMDKSSKYITDVQSYFGSDPQFYELAAEDLNNALRAEINILCKEYGHQFFFQAWDNFFNSNFDIYYTSFRKYFQFMGGDLPVLVEDMLAALPGLNLYTALDLCCAIYFTYKFNDCKERFLRSCGGINTTSLKSKYRLLVKIHELCLDFFSQFESILKLRKARLLISLTYNKIAGDFYTPGKDLKWNYLKKIETNKNNANRHKQYIDHLVNGSDMHFNDVEDDLIKLDNSIDKIEQKLEIFIDDDSFKKSKIQLANELKELDLKINDLRLALSKGVK